jgi:pimeloyl-ACP methyl ester carboxylesterase
MGAALCVLAGRAQAAPLNTDCRGARSASPTVILESGAFGTSADWDLVLDDLAKGGRVCAYDRAGVGASPPRAGAEDAVAIADELAGLLDSLGETQPVILVGHSNGALYAEAFAAKWPQRTAGLVYVNGVNSIDLDYPPLVNDLASERGLADLAGTGASIGLAPLVAGILTDGLGLKGEAAQRKRRALSDPARLRVARDEDRAMIPSLALVRDLGGSPRAVPTVLIVGWTAPGLDLSKSWRAAGAAIAARAQMSWMLEPMGATHVSPLLRDRAYIAAAVTWLRSLTSGNPKPGN